MSLSIDQKQEINLKVAQGMWPDAVIYRDSDVIAVSVNHGTDGELTFLFNIFDSDNTTDLNKAVERMMDHDNTLGKALLDTFGGKEKTYTEADLQEKLRQQREACVKAYIDWITGKPEAVEYFSPEPAIFNATIDNNGEDE